MATHNARSEDGFVPFFRRYTKTWIHAVATAGLTAFGTLTIVNRWFVVLALASYVLPPIVLYLRGRSAGRMRDAAGREAARGTGNGETTVGDREPTARANDGRTGKTPVSTGTAAGREPADETADRTIDRTGDRGTGSEQLERGVAEANAGADDAGGEGATAAEHADHDAGQSRNGASAASGTDDRDRPRGWHVVDAPTEVTLRDVSVTASGAVYAAGDDGRVIAEHRSDADGENEWVIVLEEGPSAAGADLRGVDATADGDAIWIAGDGGAVARIETDTGRHTDYSAPAGITANWLGAAVGGTSGDETVLLINGSGAVCRGRYRDGDLSWTDPVKPGGGSSLTGIALADASIGYCCDTNDGVFETTDGGDSFDRVGLEGADGTLEAVATLGRDDCLVSADDGVVHRHDTGTWTPERVADGALPGLAWREGETIACSADGEIYERSAAADWERAAVDAAGTLLAVSVNSDDGRAVAVGADGTIVDRR
ncbi:hypothetical protein [Natrinema halophilum]|uniref:Uncharacterized protein n=1 Tax=Natrinema halophilum TaxID=1699371 RepID=A0A7D5KDG4_9EURY|nr:hypothetical protein [Natrinema halophilum]QLG49381.1 hypothetical protein HYG82_11160 [Natrinema halophilum]